MVKLNKWNAVAVQEAGQKKKVIRIDQITATQPVINISTHRNDSVTIINIPHSANSIVNVNGLTMNGGEIRADKISLNTTAATYMKQTGETYGVEKGKVEVKLSNIRVSKQKGNHPGAVLLIIFFCKTQTTLLWERKKIN